MPRIQEYSPQVAPVGQVGVRRASPSAPQRLAAAGAAFGAAVSSFGKEIQEGQERRDETDANAKLIKYRAERTAELEKRRREIDVNDPEALDTFTTKFNEETAEGVAKLEGTARTPRGRQVYATHGVKLMADLSERAVVEQAQLGGQHDRNTVEAAYAYGGSVVRADPTQFDSVADQADEIVAGQRYLDGATREKLRLDGRFSLGTNFVRGMIAVNPDESIKALKEGRWDDRLGKDAKAVMIGEAEGEIRARETEVARARAEMERAKKASQQASADKLYTLFSEDKLTMKEVMGSNLDAFGENSKESFRKLIKARADDIREPIKTVQSEFTKLTNRVWAGEVTSLEEIRQSFTDRKVISKEDEQWLEREWADLQTPDGQRLGTVQKQFLDGIKPQIDKSNPLMGNLDPSGQEMFAQFQRFVAGKVAEQRAAKKDPYALFDRNSKEYLGPAAASFRTTMEQSMRNIQRNLGSAAAPAQQVEPRKEGESAADYLKRTGGTK